MRFNAVIACFVLVSSAQLAKTADRPGPAATTALQRQIASEAPASLAKSAREGGNAARGALLFHQPPLSCAQCHATGEPSGPTIGPDLTKLGSEANDIHLIESVLNPSKTIRKGYETITILTDEAETVTGLLAEERADALVLRDPVESGKLVNIPKSSITDRRTSAISSMPEGLLAGLGDRQQFLDLTRYLIEIAEQGPGRANQLRPPASFYAIPPLPEYEARLDHAGIIASLDRKSLAHGEQIYARVCANCHGTKDQPGSLPNSPRFAEAKLKHGGDPYRMYQTLTHGIGMMQAQRWMVPGQKYDVIHYVRDTYLKPHNPTQYTRVDEEYLARLPKGTLRGPAPSTIEPWANMDYGPTLALTLEVGGNSTNFAYKGIAVRLDAGPGGVSHGRHWMLYDHDTLRLAAAWSGRGFIDFNGINFNGRHEVHPRAVGNIDISNSTGPGWANPQSGGSDDRRLVGRDGRRYGPLPRDWARYKGLYHFGQQAILSYAIGETAILETPGYEVVPSADATIFSRTLDIGQSKHDLTMRIADGNTSAAIVADPRVKIVQRKGQTLLLIPAAATPLNLKIIMSAGNQEHLTARARELSPPRSLTDLVRGGPKRWPEMLSTQAVAGKTTGPFAVDVLTHPERNPWSCQMRFTGLDFTPDGHEALVCTWDGDVWRVAGVDNPAGKLTWRRIASGLFQPLGLKIVSGNVYVTCRDQIVILRDLNGDGETDFYENFNSDHQVTEHFHEFAMGLQTDAAGNFYYAKSARHGRAALVPQHGTLLRVAPNGARTDILATGFRAANGVCVNPDGSFFVTDQEGHWNPKNRINHVTPGGFYGNMWGYHDVTDASDDAMRKPLCWITNDFDRSPAELLWVTSAAWGPLRGALLNLSYGNGKIFVVPHETVKSQLQGGMCQLPVPQFPTGIIRGRFHPRDGQLYVCGMYSWAGNQQQAGGFYRVRYTGQPIHVPLGIRAHRQGVRLTFSDKLDAATAGDAKNYRIATWSLKRTAKYGSPHYDEKSLTVAKATLADDRKSVNLEIPDIRPTWCMEISYELASASGQPVRGVIHNTIHHLGE